MKLSAWKKKPLPGTLSSENGALSEHLDSTQEVANDSDTAFWLHMADVGSLTRKDFQYGMRVSKELVKMWFTGERNNPLKRARACVAVYVQGGATHCVPTILQYIAGDDFTGMVLNDEERAALMKLVKRAVQQ